MSFFIERPDALGIREQLRAAEDWHECSCGTGDRYFGGGSGGRTRHARWHLEWDRGVPIPSSVLWFDSLAIVTSESNAAEQNLAYRVGELFRKENHYDFSLVPTARSWRDGALQQVLVAIHDQRAIGLLIAGSTNQWGVFDGTPGAIALDVVAREQVPEISGIWVCRGYRRRGVATALVDALSKHANMHRSRLTWALPFSASGKALALHIGGGKARVS